MRKRTYTVTVERDIRHRAEVDVEAKDAEQAKILAAEIYDGAGSASYWREGEILEETVKVKEGT